MCYTAVLHNITCRWKCLVKTFYNRVPIVQNIVLMHRQITVTAEKVFGQAVSTSNHCPFCIAFQAYLLTVLAAASSLPLGVRKQLLLLPAACCCFLTPKGSEEGWERENTFPPHLSTYTIQAVQRDTLTHSTEKGNRECVQLKACGGHTP